MTRATLGIAVILLTVAACGSTSSAPVHHQPPAPSALGAYPACLALRADMLKNGGTPDTATLNRLTTQVAKAATDQTLLADLETAASESPAGRMQVAVPALHYDCSQVAVQLP